MVGVDVFNSFTKQVDDLHFIDKRYVDFNFVSGRIRVEGDSFAVSCFFAAMDYSHSDIGCSAATILRKSLFSWSVSVISSQW